MALWSTKYTMALELLPLYILGCERDFSSLDVNKTRQECVQFVTKRSYESKFMLKIPLEVGLW